MDMSCQLYLVWGDSSALAMYQGQILDLFKNPSNSKQPEIITEKPSQKKLKKAIKPNNRLWLYKLSGFSSDIADNF